MSKPPAQRRLEAGRQEAVGNDEGFTLLEVLVAVAILALSLTSLLGSQIESMQATRYARQISAAAFLAEYQLIEIEWEQRQDGWQTNDVSFKGDFGDQGWPDIDYECLVDYIELPEYNQMMQAKEQADQATDGDDAYTQDAADSTFSALGIVWPIIKAAIENSIRRASCTVYWKNGKVDEEFDVITFWTDPTGLTQLPQMGGEYTDEDDKSGEDSDSPEGPGQGPKPPGPGINVP
jgi:type II secretion system protein I